MVNSTTSLLVPPADSSPTGQAGLRLRDAGAEYGLQPSFAELFERTRAEQPAPTPAPKPSPLEEPRPSDDANAPESSVEASGQPGSPDASGRARASDADRSESKREDGNEETRDNDDAPDPEPTPRAALPVDLPPMMVAAVMAKPTQPAANAAPALPAAAPAKAVNAAIMPTLPEPAVPAAPAVALPAAAGNAAAPAIALRANTGQQYTGQAQYNTGQAQRPAPTSPDAPGVSMDSNALAAPAAPASGVAIALPRTALSVANNAPTSAPALAPGKEENAAAGALSVDLPVTRTAAGAVTTVAPAAKTLTPIPTRTMLAQTSSQQAQAVATDATPASGPAPTDKNALTAPVPPPVTVKAEPNRAAAGVTPAPERQAGSAPPVSAFVATPDSRAFSARPNPVGAAGLNAASPYPADAIGLPPAFATVQGAAQPLAGAATASLGETATNATVNPLTLLTTAAGASDAHAVVKAAAPTGGTERAAPIPSGNPASVTGTAAGRQAGTGAGAQNGGSGGSGGSAASRDLQIEAVSGANKTESPANASSYAAVADKTNAVSAERRLVNTESATSNTERRERIQLVAQVTKHLESLRVHDGGGEMALRLRPDHLGNLRVSIATHSDGVVARIVAEHTGVQQALESAKNELRQALENKGLRLDRLEVTVQQNGAGNDRSAFGSASGNAQDAPQRSGLRGLPRLANVPDAVAPVSALGSRRTNPSALLDRVA